MFPSLATMKNLAIIYLLLLLSSFHCDGIALKEIVKSASEANNKFSIDLYKEIIEEDDIENIVFSPYSIGLALAMTQIGAKGNSSRQLLQALNLQKDDNIELLFATLHTNVTSSKQESFTFKTANAIFHDITYPVMDGFSSSLATMDASTRSVDFKNHPQKSAREINAYVSLNTEGKIPNIVEESEIDGGTRLVLANALYFKGDWENGFNRLQSDERGFYVTRYQVIKTSFMYQRGKFNFGYIDELNLQILEMPYKGEEVSFIMLLPDTFDLANVEKNFNYKNLTTWLSQTTYQSVDVTMPKFNLSENLNVKKHLQQMGVNDIFQPNKADLSGISGYKDIYVDDILHKALLEVNEDGSVAAAATVVKMQARSLNIPVRVYADHQFIWLLMHKPTDQILFLGRLSRPEGKEMAHDEL